MLCELKVADLQERNTDSIAVAAAKALLREAVHGKPAAFSEVANRIEGRVTQRTEHSGVLSRYRCRWTCMTGSDSLLSESEIAKLRVRDSPMPESKSVLWKA